MPRLVLPPDPRVVSSFKKLSTRFDIAVICMGLMVLIGWFFNIQILKSILPQWPNSKPLSAFCLILSGVALIVTDMGSNGVPGHRKSNAGYLLAWLLLCIGLLQIILYYFHMDFGLENLLTKERVFAPVAANKKMSMLSAVCFSCLAFTLIAIRHRAPYSILHICAVIIGIPAMIEILDYFFWGGDIRFFALQKRGIVTASGFLLLSVSLLCSRPDIGWMAVVSSDTSGGKILRKLVLKILLLVVVFAESGYVAQQYNLINLETNIILSTVIPLFIIAFVTLRVARDLSIEDVKRKQAELKTEELNKSLMNRTAQLETANEELEQLINVASHDLAEPAKTVSNYSDLIQKKYGDRLDTEAPVYFNFLKQGTRTMSAILKDVLTYGNVCKLGSIEMCDFNAIIADVLAELKEQINAHKAIITIAPLPKFHCHKDMKQVFYHLISNALKFRKTEVPPEINICCVSRGNKWQFIVRDNGIGIESQYYEKIFKLFQRLHPKHEYEGSGLGLAICKKAVEFHHGEIWVESTPDGGSTFHFTISKTLKEEKEAADLHSKMK